MAKQGIDRYTEILADTNISKADTLRLLLSVGQDSYRLLYLWLVVNILL